MPHATVSKITRVRFRSSTCGACETASLYTRRASHERLLTVHSSTYDTSAEHSTTHLYSTTGGLEGGGLSLLSMRSVRGRTDAGCGGGGGQQGGQKGRGATHGRVSEQVWCGEGGSTWRQARPPSAATRVQTRAHPCHCACVQASGRAGERSMAYRERLPVMLGELGST
jgi:hypothetical protein